MRLIWTSRIELSKSGIARIKQVSGVYKLIYYNNSDNKYYVYYVGQATDLNSRLTDHTIDYEENECCQKYLKNYSCFFRAARVLNQSDRDSIEVTLYHKYEPDCVEKIPNAKPIDINFE